MLLHVLGQVRLLCVALAAELADVSFQMFGLFVLRDVVEECVLVDETLVAGVALVRLVRLVASGVGLEVGELREGFAALGTLVGLGLAHVDLGVKLEIRFGAENLERK